MDEDLADNRSGRLSARQHSRLAALPGAAGAWARHVGAQGTSGYRLAHLVRSPPDGLADDLAEGRVESAEGTVALEPIAGITPTMRRWVARLDDGEALDLAPGSVLPPGRMRLFALPRSRWVVHGEPRAEHWEDYRALVDRAQGLAPAEVDALRAGRFPPRFGTRLRKQVRLWWLPPLLAAAWLVGLVVEGASPSGGRLAFALLLSVAGLWGARHLVLAHRDASGEAVAHHDGAAHIDVIIGRQQTVYQLLIGGMRFRLPPGDAALVEALQDGLRCRAYHGPRSGLFVAIEPLIPQPTNS